MFGQVCLPPGRAPLRQEPRARFPALGGPAGAGTDSVPSARRGGRRPAPRLRVQQYFPDWPLCFLLAFNVLFTLPLAW